MNYRHLYHAGNFADVFKHIILIAILQSLSRKEAPFCYLETHGGAGGYYLELLERQAIKEHEEGIGHLIGHAASLGPELHPIINDYLKIIQYYQYPGMYPGSPLIAEKIIRSQDRMILMELHSEEYSDLKKLMNKKSHIAVHHLDGYQGLKAYLPPKERRGLILIDPPFEKRDEWNSLINALISSIKKFSTGVYAVWYPIKDKLAVSNFKMAIKKSIEAEILVSEITVYPEDAELGLMGCGMLIINPPWQLDLTLTTMVPQIWKLLTRNQSGHYSIEKL